LTGRWGLGKSSVLNILAGKLSAMNDVVVVTFNPWLFKGRDELVVGFFNSLRGAIGRSRSERMRDLVTWIDRYWGALKFAGHGVAAAVDMYGGGGAASTAFSRWEPSIRAGIVKPSPRSPDEERTVLEQKLSDTQFAVVVLVDELDRIEDDEVRAVAQLIKAVGEIKGISYLVAYDAERVILALGRGEGDARRESGEKYLEKIIQHAIPLRPLFTEDSTALISETLKDHSITLDPTIHEYQKQILDSIANAIETPRDVKRFIGAFSVVWHMVRDEICPYDVLAYCWILTKSCEMQEKFSANIDYLVNDPGMKASMEAATRILNREESPDLVKLFGSTANTHKALLRLLFPALFRNRTSDDGNRLSRRRNLVRMLYLGNPPNMMRRAELEAIWIHSDPTELERTLRQLKMNGRLEAALDRLDDLVIVLPEHGDRTFWVALSRALCRQSNWLAGYEEERRFADDAASTLIRLGYRDNLQVSRLQVAMASLVDSNDLLLAPWILLKHIFAHGLTEPSQGTKGGGILSKEETETLMASEIIRYRQAVLDGTLLKHVPRCEALVCLALSGKMDESTRQSFTDQLSCPDSISTFAGLMVPPGYTVDRNFLNILFDADTIRDRIDLLFSKKENPSNSWLNISLQRLKKILDGQNLEYDGIGR